MSRDYTDIIGEVMSNEPDQVQKPNNRYDEFLPELFNDVSPNEESFIRDRDFEEDYIPDQFAFDDSQVQDVNQLQAELQPWMDKAGAFVGKTVGKTLIEFTKGLGYLASSPAALVTGDLENMTNNFFIEALDEAGEELNDALPVYVKNSIRDGNLLDNLGSMDFWANEGADGLGFLLSSIGIGGVVNKLGKLASLSNKANLGLTSAAQTLVESAAETSGLSTQLNDYWEGRLQNDGSYLDENNNLLSAEEVQERKGQALASTFWSNAMLLAIPNMVMTNTIFGKGSTMNNMLGSKTAGIKGASSLDNMMANLEKITPWKAGARNAVKNVAKVGSSEGFQEWSQFAIEDYNSKLAKNLTDDGILSGLYEGYTKGLTEVEGQKAIALGFLFGAGTSVIGSYKDGKATAKKQKGLASLINNASNSYKDTLKSIYTIDENGNYKVNPEKVADLLDSNIKDLTLEDFYKKSRANGETAAAKYALGKLAIQHASKFMNQEEGMDIWDRIVEENDETYQADHKELGFASKNEMKQYIKDVAKSAKRENDRFIEEGYKLFNINKKLLYRNKDNKAQIDEAYNEFINKMSNVNIELNFQRDALKKAVTKLKQAIATEQENIIPAENEEGETERNVIIDIFNKQLEGLNKQLRKVNKEYTSLYDPAEHESAFNKYYFSKLNLKDAVAQDGIKKQERGDIVQQFYQDLEDKGYKVLDNPEINDFSRDIIALVDKEGTVYKVGKRRLENGSTEFVIKNIETNEATPFTADLLETKFVGSDAILSTKEFSELKRAKKVLQLNQKKLDILNTLISDNAEQNVKAIETLEELNKEAEFYNDYLENIDLETTSRPANEILKDIQEASELLDSINGKINSLKDTLNTLEESKGILLDLKTQLEQIIEENKDAEILQNFSFNKIYQDIKSELADNKIDTKIDDIDTSIEYAELVIDEWSDIQSDFQDVVDGLYESLGDYKWLRDFIPTLTKEEFEEIKILIQFENPLISEEDAENYLGLEDASDLKKFIKIKELLNSTGSRAQVLRLLSDKVEATSIYLDIAKQDLASMTSKVNKAKEKLKKLVKFKELSKIETLFANSLLNIKREYNLQAAKDMTISPNQVNDNPEQQDSSSSNYYAQRKTTPFSSIISIWDYIGNGNIDYENGRNGKSKNWKQAALWANAVKDIDNTKIDEYNVRFMSPTQLQNLGITPPSSKKDDVYIVLYHNGELVKKDNQIPFAGLAFPATYFNENNSISLRDNKVFKSAVAKKKAMGDEFSFEYNGNTYTDLANLETDLYTQLQQEYSEWRNNIVNLLSQDKSLYSQATNFSPGMPVIEDSNTKNPASKVFKDVKEIVIPSSDRYGIGDKVVKVEPGQVYVKTNGGQLHRVLNRRIDSLSPKKKADTINKILKFMALGYFLKGNLQQNVKVAGSKKGSYPLIGSKNGTGVLDYYINWGDKKSFSHSISIGTQKKTGEMFVKLIDPKNEKTVYFDLKDLFNGTPSEKSVKPYGDPTIKLITDFLESKYLNVNKKMATSQPKGFDFWLPSDWKMVKGVPQIVVDKSVPKRYKDYALKEVLYTNTNESKVGDEIPNFVNQYVSFDKDLSESPKKPTKPKEKGPVTEEESFFEGPPLSNYEAGPVSFSDGAGSLKKFEMMAQMAAATSEPKSEPEKEQVQETCEIPNGQVNMFEKMQKLSQLKGEKLDL